MEETEKTYRDIRQHNMFREMQVLGCVWSIDARLVGGGGEDGDMMLNDRQGCKSGYLHTGY